MTYRRRIIDDALGELLPELAAIALEGATAVGKTAAAAQRARTVIDLSAPAMRQVIRANADIITQSPPPVLIDECRLLNAVSVSRRFRWVHCSPVSNPRSSVIRLSCSPATSTTSSVQASPVSGRSRRALVIFNLTATFPVSSNTSWLTME